ncbi:MULTISPECIES: DUF5617 domain-containing protein [Cysteiniphilum]|uniref:DUF5617 domain-containing protein n=1 Tax=Cysteiniphilum TaxID=2056696 RepID=UPI00178450E6|nr:MULTISPECIES: DUF5617 domain-containing protein [Cysteiniphilum]
MGLFDYAKYGVSSTVGAVAGYVVLPSYAAQATRSAVSYLWGATTGILSSVAKTAAIENAGHYAFSVAQNFGGPAGFAAGVAANALLDKAVNYGIDFYTSESKLKNEVTTGELTKDKVEKYLQDYCDRGQGIKGLFSGHWRHHAIEVGKFVEDNKTVTDLNQYMKNLKEFQGKLKGEAKLNEHGELNTRVEALESMFKKMPDANNGGVSNVI